MNEHGGLVNLATAQAALLEVRPDSRILQFASMSFDVMAEELYPTWANGATLVLRPEGVSTSFAHGRCVGTDHPRDVDAVGAGVVRGGPVPATVTTLIVWERRCPRRRPTGGRRG
jgi:hypothetical protein